MAYAPTHTIKRGTRFRLTKPASLRYLKPIQGGWTCSSHKLPAGTVVIFQEEKWGWGSDPGRECIFQTEDGRTGAASFGGGWGGVDMSFIEPLNGEGVSDGRS